MWSQTDRERTVSYMYIMYIRTHTHTYTHTRTGAGGGEGLTTEEYTAQMERCAEQIFAGSAPGQSGMPINWWVMPIVS